MHAPKDELWDTVGATMSRIDVQEGGADPATLEGTLLEVLKTIDQGLNAAIADAQPLSGEEELAAVQSWAALMSYALNIALSPGSGLGQRARAAAAGIAAKVGSRLQSLIGKLRPSLASAASKLGAKEYQIATQLQPHLPPSFTIAITWPAPHTTAQPSASGTGTPGAPATP